MDYEQQQTRQMDYMDIEGKNSVSSNLSIGSNRVAFIRKVYSILSVQMLFTVIFTVIAYSNKSFQIFQAQNQALLILTMIIGFIVEIAIICCKSVARKVPNNYIALFIFTFCQAYLVSAVCSSVFLVYSKNGAEIVLAAALLTLAMTLALTAYAFTTSSDFTMIGGLLFMLGFGLLFLGILTMIFNSPFMNLLYAFIATLLYGMYLIYDTQLIAGGRQHELDIDDYIIAALIIYIDIVLLFLQVLQILLEIFGKRD